MSRFRLLPTPAQQVVLLEHCRHARFVWNLAVEQQQFWQPGRHAPGYNEECAQLTAVRAEYEWLAAGSQTVQQQALRDFAQAMRNFFAGTHRRPTWRKAGVHEGFRQVGVKPSHIEKLNRRYGRVWVPKIGWVRFCWTRAVPAGIKSYRITRDRAGRWHIAFAHIPDPIAGPGDGSVVGVDRGVTVSAALSSGELLHAPSLTPGEQTRLRRLQQRLARAQRGSHRRARTKLAIAKLRARETDRRRDWVEKTSTDLARRFDVIRVEDLDVRAMTRSARGTRDQPGVRVAQKRGLNRSISHQGWGRLVARLDHKAAGRLERLPAAYTSQRCAACGHIAPENRKSQAVFACVACKAGPCNADVNAARNIAAGRAVAAQGDLAIRRSANCEPQTLFSCCQVDRTGLKSSDIEFGEDVKPVVCLDVDPRDLAFAGASEQARMLAEGAITAPELLDVYLERIAGLDPQLRSYRIIMADTARKEAEAAQRRLDAGERLGLLGVPVAIKDDVDVEGELTTYGTSAVSTPASRDAEVVRRLRSAGAVIVGKTAVPELMMLPYTESLTFGATRNPWNTAFTPGGSSGGSGAAVAAGLAPLALGSDGGGSIRIPSGWCGLFGLKPQRDRVSVAPHDDAWCGLSVNGPIARSVKDAALFLDVTTTMPGPDGGFVAAAGRDPGRLRIALSTKAPPPLILRCGKEQRAAVDEASALLRDLGHHVVARDPDYPPAAIAGNYLPRYLRGVHNDVRSMPHPDRLEARTRHMARIGSLFSERRMAAVRAAEPALAARIQSIFDDVDVVVTPGNATGPSRVGAYQRRGAVSSLLLVSRRVPFFEIWNLTGQPAAAVPWGLDRNGIPLSIQLVDRPCDEATLLSLSAQVETARPWAHRRPPVS